MSSDVHVNAPLTNISLAFMQQAKNFIADRVFPNIPVKKQGDRYFTYERRDWLRNEVKERAPGTESSGSGFRVNSNASYFAPVFAVHKDVDDQMRANQDTPLDMDRDGTEWVSQQMMAKRDILWALKYFGTGLWTGSTTGTDIVPATKWDAALSTPVENITAQIIAMAGKTGYRPNKMVITPTVFDVLRNNADILDRIKYTERGIVTEDLLASVFGIDEVVVPWGVQDTSVEGAATDATDFIIKSDQALLVYAEPNPGILKASAGYTFSWNGYLGAGAFGSRIKKFRMEELSSDRVEGEMAFDQKLVASILGVFFNDVLT
jgi:hypothetical protein